MSALIALALFALGVVTDVAWARWALTVNARKAKAAAVWAMLIVLPYAATVNAYVIPYAAGCGLGTYLVTK